MNSIYARPENPVKLSQDCIQRRIHGGEKAFCGRCGKLMETDLLRTRVLACDCIPNEMTISPNKVSSLRIVNGQILYDTILVTDENFNPEIHAPSFINLCRLVIWDKWKRGIE